MASTTYAAIHVGSNELCMKIYEMSRQNGIRQLTYVRHPLSLGAESYTEGVISYQTLTEICNTLNDFKRIMTEFHTDSWDVCATSAMREAKNVLVVTDQIKIQTGFKVKLFSNSEARFLYFKGMVHNEGQFEPLSEEGCLVLDIGAGSVQLSLFQNGHLQLTQNLLLGSSRIQELLYAMQDEAYDYDALIDEYIEKDLSLFKRLNLNKKEIHCILAAGEMIPETYYHMKEAKKDFDGFLPDKIFTKKKMLKLMGNIHAQSLLPTLLLMRKITQLTDCQNVLLSPINLCDGLAADYAERKLRLSCGHDFTEDILSASRNVAQKYEVDLNHIDTVQTLALQIFDRIKKIHGLGKRERLLLQLGVILHGCGAYINALHARECSYHILLSTEIIGISHKERLIVANMIRYNDESFPSFEELDGDFSREEYITIVKLNAILKIANVLDKSNRQKIKNVGVSERNGILTITADTMADITLEKGLFLHKADVFEEVFGIRPVLKQKRTGKRG